MRLCLHLVTSSWWRWRAGEHVDYSGYSVLPMAIAYDAVALFAPWPAPSAHHDRPHGHWYPIFTLHNVDAGFAPVRVEYRYDAEVDDNGELALRAVPLTAAADNDNDDDGAIAVHDAAATRWSRYFVAALRGVVRHFGVALHEQPRRWAVTVHGSVPVGSGLSSSASVTCAYVAGLARVLAPQRAPFDKAELAALAAESERSLGVSLGGMDQAISFVASRHSASLIHFRPRVLAAGVRLPRGASFVMANSLVAHELQGHAAGAGYNQRVVECRLAAAVLAKRLALPHWERVRRLHEVQEALAPSPHEWHAPERAAAVAHDMVSALERAAHLVRESELAGLETLADVARVLELGSPAHVAKLYCAELLPPDGGDLAPSHTFRLHDRALHVFEESARVWRFAHLCAAAANDRHDTTTTDDDDDDEQLSATLGLLMSASHRSCRELFECSCPELEAVVAELQARGAAGARLTGAGWGGWAVALLPPSCDVPAFIAGMQRDFYEPRLRSLHASASPAELRTLLDGAIMASTPGEGAYLYVASEHGQ